MTLLRPLLLMVMIVAFLPWGAFSAKFAVAGNAEATASETIIAVDPSGAENPVVVDRPKRCKGSALPGSPCGPAIIATLSVEEPTIVQPFSKAMYIWREDHLDGTDDPAVLDPPILA